MRKKDRPPSLKYQGPYRAGASLESPIKSPAGTVGDPRSRHLSISVAEDDGTPRGGLPPPSPAVLSASRRRTAAAAKRRRRWRCCCGCYCACACLLLLLVAALGIAALCLFLVLKPQAPTFELQDLSITTFGVRDAPPPAAAAGAPPATLLSLDMQYRVLAGNPNKVPIHYAPANLTLFYAGAAIGHAQIPAFVERSRSRQNLTGAIRLRDVAVGAAAPQLALDFLGGTVPLQVNGVVAASVDIWGIHTPQLTVFADCNVTINVGTRALASKQCRIHL